jgi:hypothetical protein
MTKASTAIVADAGQQMVAFLGVPADTGLLDEDVVNLPGAEQYRPPVVLDQRHERLVAAGSAMTGATLIGGAGVLLYGGWQLLFQGGGVFDALLVLIGILLAGTHWGWVHVAEYAGLTLDEHQRRSSEARGREWLAALAPYPRFSVTTIVLDDASTRVERILHRPVLTARQTFTFVRETIAAETYDADTPAEVIATAVETMRRQARLDTDRLRELWEAASSAYTAAMLNAQDDAQQLAARRAAATALSEHINASLLEPPLVE